MVWTLGSSLGSMDFYTLQHDWFTAISRCYLQRPGLRDLAPLGICETTPGVPWWNLFITCAASHDLFYICSQASLTRPRISETYHLIAPSDVFLALITHWTNRINTSILLFFLSPEHDKCKLTSHSSGSCLSLIWVASLHTAMPVMHPPLMPCNMVPRILA